MNAIDNLSIESEAFLVGRRKWTLTASLGVAIFALAFLWNAAGSVFLPNEVERFAPNGKEQYFSVLMTVTSILSTLTSILAGALSDRFKNRFGRRRPWILLGALAGSVALWALTLAKGQLTLYLFWLLTVVFLNLMQALLFVLLAERIASKERGTVSAVMGTAVLVGAQSGIFVAGKLADHMDVVFMLVALVIASIGIAFFVLNPEPPTPLTGKGAFHWTQIFKGLWVSPSRHPDFAWAFLGRVLIYIAYFLATLYFFYFIQDYLTFGRSRTNETIALLSLVNLAVSGIVALLSGILSDLTGNKKAYVIGSGIALAIAMLVPIALPNLFGLIVYTILLAMSFSVFQSVNLALVTQVLPSSADTDESKGKDMGILTAGQTVSQIAAPVLGTFLLGASHDGYRMLFMAAALFAVAGAIATIPIRSVR